MIGDQTKRCALPGLNGMRALACLAVFGVHFQQHTGVGGTWWIFDVARLLENGNTGVAVFFVLSGFLLSLGYWSGQEQRRDTSRTLRTYATRRLARIVPAYFLCLTVLVLVHGHWTTPKQCADTALHYLFLHNYTEFSFYSISEPFWTIAIQAQFYMIFPVLLLLLRPLGARGNAAFVVLLGMCAGCFVIHHWVMTQATGAGDWPVDPQLVSQGGTVLSHSVLAHLPHFLLGVLAGGVFSACGTSAHSPSPWAAAGCEFVFWTAGAIVIAVLATPLDDAIQLPHGRYHFPIVPLLIAAMIVCASLAKPDRGLLNSRPLAALGTISYGVYVYHLPCQNTTVKIMRGLGLEANSHWMIFGLTSLAMAVLVATVSYHVLERPVLRATHPKDPAG